MSQKTSSPRRRPRLERPRAAHVVFRSFPSRHRRQPRARRLPGGEPHQRSHAQDLERTPKAREAAVELSAEFNRPLGEIEADLSSFYADLVERGLLGLAVSAAPSWSLLPQDGSRHPPGGARADAHSGRLQASVSFGLDERTPSECRSRQAGRDRARRGSSARPRVAAPAAVVRAATSRRSPAYVGSARSRARLSDLRASSRRHLVMNDGRQVTSALPDIAPWK